MVFGGGGFMYGIQVFELPIRYPHRDGVWTFGYRSLNFQ